MIRLKREVRHTFTQSAEVGAGSAGLELAVLALENEPVRSGVAHVAHPLDEATLGFDDFEGVDTARWYSHCSKFCLGFVLVVSLYWCGSES